jgi:hypothetical protein
MSHQEFMQKLEFSASRKLFIYKRLCPQRAGNHLALELP